MKQLIIDGKKSYEDFNLYISDRKISQPKKKSVKESIPFSNVVYDFSKMNGEIYWEQRTLQYVFDFAELSTEEMEIAKSKALTWFMNVHDTDIYDPYIGDYHFHGSFESDSWDEDFGAGTLTINFSVYPYKISNSDSSVIEKIGLVDETFVANFKCNTTGNLQRLKVFGESKQETTNGYQLVDFSNGTTATGVTATFVNDVLTVIGDGSLPYQSWSKDITGVITGNPSKVLYCDFENLELTDTHDGSIIQLNITHNDGTNSYIQLCSVSGIKKSYIVPSDVSNIKSVHIAVYSSNASTSKANTVTITKPIFQFGIDKLPYEKYTNGASPNPDYPSEIENVEGIRNLLNTSGFNNTTANGITSTRNADGSIKLNGTSTAITNFWLTNLNTKLKKGTYSFITNVSLINRGRFLLQDSTSGSNVVIYNGVDKLRFTLTKDMTLSEMLLQVNSGATFTNETFYLMLINHNSTSIPYVPYGSNYLLQRICGKNIVPTNFSEWESGDYDGAKGTLTVNAKRLRVNRLIKVEPNTTYFAKTSSYNFVLREYNNTKTFVRSIGGIASLGTGTTFTTSESSHYIGVAIYDGIDYVTFEANWESIKPFICLNSETNKNYELYKEKQVLIDLQGNILGNKDEVESIGGSLTKKTYEIVLTGDEAFTENGIYSGLFALPNVTMESNEYDIVVISTHFKAISQNKMFVDLNTGYNNDLVISGYTNDRLFIVYKEYAKNLAGFKAYLKEQYNNGTPVIVQYISSKPQRIQLTPTTIPIYSGTNNVVVESNLDTTIEVGYNVTKTLNIINNSSHRIAPTITSDGQFTITLNNKSYSIGEGTYTSGFYLEMGTNVLNITGYGNLNISYVEEMF